MADFIYAGDAGAFKTCTKCMNPKSLDSFHANPGGLAGRHSLCIECKNSNNKTSYSVNSATFSEKRRVKFAESPETLRLSANTRSAARRRGAGKLEIGSHMNCKRCDIDCIARGPAQKYCLDCAAIVQKENVKLWALGNAESERERNARQREADPVRHASYGRKWRLANRDKVNAAYNARMADPKKRLDKAISRSIAACLSGAKDGRTWESLVGYSLGELTRHLEKLFLPGMTWENYGDWHVDHVIPKSIFNYSRSEHLDFSRAWSLKNLQPLWATDNHKKSNKFGSQFQPSLALEC